MINSNCHLQMLSLITISNSAAASGDVVLALAGSGCTTKSQRDGAVQGDLLQCHSKMLMTVINRPGSALRSNTTAHHGC